MRWRYSVFLLVFWLAHSAKAEDFGFSCPTGMEYETGLCASQCPVGWAKESYFCRQGCKSGYKYNKWTTLCEKKNFWDFRSYSPKRTTRDTATPRSCSSQSFSRTVDTSQDPSTFTLIVSSDPQLPWWRGSTDKALELRQGKKTNAEQVRAMNAIGNIKAEYNGRTTYGVWPDSERISHRGEAVSKPLGVIINGDLTAFWQHTQVDLFKQYYHSSNKDNSASNLKLDIFPGLGNHDYENNVQDCWWYTDPNYLGDNRNGCAQNATHYIKKMIGCGTVPNFPQGRVTSYDENSLAYSFEIGDWHFVQLNNYASYSVPSLGVSSAIPWLRGDLEQAYQAGKHIVINMHQPMYSIELYELMRSYSVKAVFVGHYHARVGVSGNYSSTSVPEIYSGAAEYNTFLLVRFSSDSMTVGVVSSSEGEAEFSQPSRSSHLKTWQY